MASTEERANVVKIPILKYILLLNTEGKGEKVREEEILAKGCLI